jgi:hypothetical protein
MVVGAVVGIVVGVFVTVVDGVVGVVGSDPQHPKKSKFTIWKKRFGLLHAPQKL